MSEPEYLKVDEVARLLRQSANSVYRKLEAGQLPGIKIGVGPNAPWRVKAVVLDQWLEDRHGRDQ